VTSPNLLVFTLVSISLDLRERSLTSFSTPSSDVACPSGGGDPTVEGAQVDELGRSRTTHSLFLEELELIALEE
jgi:hypothetical protein